ncbi:hypothetical protein [Capnocytophaga gingivalis]|jgi:hypothetical protein|uniref:hypothetical protein n=1 Tax=Capnocytophaga gingivalis TaxID=1017 RepID=UPI0028D1B50D|nr:hypothetical protein [Capnocytophaga gingivalis]
MNTTDFLIKYIQDWFWIYRPELDLRGDEAERLYNEIKEILLLDKVKVITNEEGEVISNERDEKAMLVRDYLEENYTSYTNLVCAEVLEEDEFRHATAAMKEIGFFYEEEYRLLVRLIKEADWYKQYRETKDLFDDESFKEHIRQMLRERRWNAN